MSAAQTLASKQFLDAMGTMVNEEKSVNRVLRFITYMKEEVCPTISDEEYGKLIPVETMFADLKAMVHDFYQSKKA